MCNCVQLSGSSSCSKNVNFLGGALMRLYYHSVFKFLKRQSYNSTLCLLMHEIQIQYSRDTIHTYPLAELKKGRGLPCQLFFLLQFFFTQNRGGGGPPSLDPPLDICFIATPYKGFQFTRLHNCTTKVV